MAMRRTTAGLTQGIINDLDEGVRPASILDGRGESVLTRRAFPMRKHLVQGRLADIHQGLAAEGMGVNFRVLGGVHAGTSLGGMACRRAIAVSSDIHGPMERRCVTPRGGIAEAPRQQPFLHQTPGVNRYRGAIA